MIDTEGKRTDDTVLGEDEAVIINESVEEIGEPDTADKAGEYVSAETGEEPEESENTETPEGPEESENSEAGDVETDEDGSGAKKAGEDESADSDEEESGKKDEKYNWKKELRDWLIIIVSAVILAWALTHFVIMKTEVISGSMIATLNVDDRVVANRLSYVFSKPKRGDIIFFAYPDDESKTYVKRIIGLPGETVEIIQGKVYINNSDEPLNEPYLNGKMRKEDFGPYVVPESSYFVMGDNRNVSVDSRYWDNTFVTVDEIYGKAWFIYDTRLHKVRETEDNEYVVTNRLAYIFSSPKYGDLVTLKQKVDGHKDVRRVIACPGDKVEVRDWVLYINDAPKQDADYSILTDSWGPYSVPEGKYLAIYDEQQEWSNIDEMCVSKSDITGKAWIVFHIGFKGVKGASYETQAE